MSVSVASHGKQANLALAAALLSMRARAAVVGHARGFGGVGERAGQRRLLKAGSCRCVVLTGNVGAVASQEGGRGGHEQRRCGYGFTARGATIDQGHRATPCGKRGGVGGSRTIVTMGLPIPFIGGLFTAPVLAVMYIFVAIRFWLGYAKTTYTEQNKAMMVGLWPVLVVASKSFRENFKKAL